MRSYRKVREIAGVTHIITDESKTKQSICDVDAHRELIQTYYQTPLLT